MRRKNTFLFLSRSSFSPNHALGGLGLKLQTENTENMRRRKREHVRKERRREITLDCISIRGSEARLEREKIKPLRRKLPVGVMIEEPTESRMETKEKCQNRENCLIFYFSQNKTLNFSMVWADRNPLDRNKLSTG